MAQDYDKIIKENIKGLLPALIERVLKLQIVHMEKIPFDVQVTLERRPDFLLQVQGAESEAPYVLQIEFQSTNDDEMANRLLEYMSILRRLRIDKYIQQLEVISKLRSLQEETTLQSEQMALTYNLTEDIRYKQGIEKGKKEGIEKGIEKGKKEGKKEGREINRIETLRKMLLSKPFLAGLINLADIAEVTGSSLEEVEAIHRKMLEQDTRD